MLLRSRALEITVEGCITSPLPADHVSGLQSLLAAFAPRCDAAAASAAVAQLAALLADDTQGFDTAGAAQRGVHALVAALKGDAAGAGAGGAAEQQRSASLTDRLSIIEREASKQRGFLAAVDGLLADSGKAKLPGQGSGVTKCVICCCRRRHAVFDLPYTPHHPYQHKQHQLFAPSAPHAAALRCAVLHIQSISSTPPPPRVRSLPVLTPRNLSAQGTHGQWPAAGEAVWGAL